MLRPSTPEAGLSAQTFFDEVCPKVLAKLPASDALTGVLVVRLFGSSPGAWTVDLGARAVRPGVEDSRDLLLEMNDEDFSAMLEGKLDVEAALEDGRVRNQGNLEVLVRFGAILEGVEG